MKKAFYKLKESKQKNIIDACIFTFAKHGYDLNTTDRIVKKAGISKGALYEYAYSKEKLYLYIIEYTYDQLYDYIQEKLLNETKYVPDDILDRLEIVYSFVFDYYSENPLHVKLLANNYFTATEKLKTKIEKIYLDKFTSIFHNTETKNFKYGKHEIYSMISWMLVKVRLEFLEIYKNSQNIKAVKKSCFKKWSTYIKILQTGIYK